MALPSAPDLDKPDNSILQDNETARARRRAGLVAAVAGLLMVPWGQLALHVDPTRTGGSGVDFYADHVTGLTVSATLFIGQWTIVLVLLVAVVRAACRRLELAAILAITLAGVATAVYVAADGIRVWPVLASNMDSGDLRKHLDPTLARAALDSRDGIHAGAAVVLGFSVLLIAWVLARSDLWGHRAMSVLAVVAGAWALSSIVVGPDGFGPGFIFVLWAPVVAILLLVGRWRSRSAE